MPLPNWPPSALKSCWHPAQHAKALVYSLGKLSTPNPSLPWHQPGFQWLAQETWMLALWRPTAAKGSAMGTRVRRKRRRRKGRGYCLGQQQTAVVCKTLIWSSGHLVWLTLIYILTLFFRCITYRNVWCALLSKIGRQAYNICFSFLFLISEVLWEI